MPDHLALRLTDLLTRYRTIRAHLGSGRQPRLPPPEQLAHLLARLHPLLRARAQIDARGRNPILVPERVEACLAALRGPLQEARARGDGIDLWTVARLGRQEVRNAAVLAWLIDPRASHGQGARVLQALFAGFGDSRPAWATDEALGRVSVATEERPLGSDRDRVDIALEGSTFVLFIEVKVDAPEGEAQLTRYAQAAQAKARAQHKAHALVLFVSPRPPRDRPEGLLVLTWTSIARALEMAAASGRPGLSRQLLIQYADHVRRFT